MSVWNDIRELADILPYIVIIYNQLIFLFYPLRFALVIARFGAQFFYRLLDLADDNLLNLVNLRWLLRCTVLILVCGNHFVNFLTALICIACVFLFLTIRIQVLIY